MQQQRIFVDNSNNFLISENQNFCLLFEREKFNSLKKSLEKFGVYSCIYILYSRNETITTIYIGKASKGHIRNRINSHIKDPDKKFWTDAVVFSSSEIDDKDVLFMESFLIKKAKDLCRCNLWNKKEENYDCDFKKYKNNIIDSKIKWFNKKILLEKLRIEAFFSFDDLIRIKKNEKHFSLLTYYEILEVSISASLKEIEVAYESQKTSFDDKKNADKLRFIDEAYENLKCPNKRKFYDKKLFAQDFETQEKEQKQEKIRREKEALAIRQAKELEEELRKLEKIRREKEALAIRQAKELEEELRKHDEFRIQCKKNLEELEERKKNVIKKQRLGTFFAASPSYETRADTLMLAINGSKENDFIRIKWQEEENKRRDIESNEQHDTRKELNQFTNLVEKEDYKYKIFEYAYFGFATICLVLCLIIICILLSKICCCAFPIIAIVLAVVCIFK